VAEPRGQDLPDRAQCPGRRFLDAGTGRGGELEGDGQGDGLLVVEQQWRQLCPGVEPVPAVRTLHGPDRIAQLTEAVDVSAHRARTDLEPLGQQRPRPVPARLQQREQGEQARGRRRHGYEIARNSGQKLTATRRTVGVQQTTATTERPRT